MTVTNGVVRTLPVTGGKEGPVLHQESNDSQSGNRPFAPESREPIRYFLVRWADGSVWLSPVQKTSREEAEAVE